MTTMMTALPRRCAAASSNVRWPRRQPGQGELRFEAGARAGRGQNRAAMARLIDPFRQDSADARDTRPKRPLSSGPVTRPMSVNDGFQSEARG